MSKFNEELAAMIAAKYQSREHFVAVIEPDLPPDIGGCALSYTLRNKIRPPLEELPKWANALKLTPKQTARFIDLALITRMPAEYQPRFEALLATAAPLMPTSIPSEVPA
jgi:hypothetical protein